MATGATNEYGVPIGDLVYGGGNGYIPYTNDLIKEGVAQQLGEGSLGQNLLTSLMDLKQNPASGPLGLAAYGAFGGNGQSIAKGTNGAGIVNPYSGAFDRALSGMLSGVFGDKGSIYNPDNAGQVNTADTTFRDPNKAPAMTPNATAGAPNVADAWRKAWQAYHPGETQQTGDVGSAASAAPGALNGAKIDLTNSVRDGVHHFIAKATNDADFADRIAKVHKVTTAVKKMAEHVPAERMPMNASGAPGYANGGVVVGGEPHFIVDSAGNTKARITEDGQPERVSGTPGGVEVTPMNPVRNALYEQSKKWSRVLAGMDSMFGQQPATGQGAPSAPGAPIAPGAAPGAAMGGEFKFPEIPGSGVNTGATGSNLLPSAGGPGMTRANQVGSFFKSSYDPTTGHFTLPSEATDNTTANDNAGYAKMLGGAWSAGNTAINSDTLRSLNAGKAPDKLLSATEYSTLPDSQRKGYLAFLQQTLGLTPEDAQGAMKRFAPTALP